MIGHLPGEVIREVAELARTSHWRHADLVTMPHADRRMWLAAFAGTDDGVGTGDGWG